MSKKGTIRIGLLGFGVVGQGVWKNIKNNHQALEHRLGAKIEITEVVVRSLEREREVKLPDSVLSVDPARVVAKLISCSAIISETQANTPGWSRTWMRK